MKTTSHNIAQLGQVFTPAPVVEKMLALRRNSGRVLEPASGDGAFLAQLEASAVGVEIDHHRYMDGRVIPADFFAYPASEKFDTIIGNPPYVRHRNILTATKQHLDMAMFDGRANLYLFFIAKCVEHLRDGGELIFITPRDFIKATSARRLNEMLYQRGAMTHYVDLGDAAPFARVAPNCAIWRWQKGRQSRRMENGAQFCCANGQLWFGAAGGLRLGDFFEVKVGAVSGADEIFTNPARGCTDMVCSTTATDGKTRRMIYQREDESLLPHKARLLARRVRRFNESNWWEWGRQYCVRDGARIYVNAKTRMRRPFFASEVTAYDASVLALFPKVPMDLETMAEKLNGVDWEALGFVCGGRFLFTQRSLETAAVNL